MDFLKRSSESGILVQRQHLLKVRQNNSDEEPVPAYVYIDLSRIAPIDGGGGGTYTYVNMELD